LENATRRFYDIPCISTLTGVLELTFVWSHAIQIEISDESSPSELVLIFGKRSEGLAEFGKRFSCRQRDGAAQNFSWFIRRCDHGMIPIRVIALSRQDVPSLKHVSQPER